jgi:signal transduction histidine kinase
MTRPDVGVFRLRAAIAMFAVVTGAVVIWQKQLAVPPAPGLPLVLACVLPFLADLRWPRLASSSWTAVVAVLVVLASATTLMTYRPSAGDFTVFVFILVAARVAASVPASFSVPVGVLAFVLPALASAAAGRHEYPAAAAGTVIAWLAGFGMRRQASLTSQLVAARATAAAHQISAERQQLAREFHDLVAHTLAVTLLHLSALRMSLDDREIDEALESLGEAERAGREAMREMRQAVALLRGPSTDGPATALPRASDLPDLIDGYAAAGLNVSLDVTGDLSTVGGDTGLATYRIVQESLTNTAKHAPTSAATVSVHVNGTDLELNVVNDIARPARDPVPGHGIRGMAQRATLLGGSFSAGSAAGDHADRHRWSVRARLPLDAR